MTRLMTCLVTCLMTRGGLRQWRRLHRPIAALMHRAAGGDAFLNRQTGVPA